MDEYTETELKHTFVHEWAKAPRDPPTHSHNGHTPSANSASAESASLSFYEMNDGGNARRLLDAHGEDMRFNADTERWHAWTGNAWEEDRAQQVQSWMQAITRGMWAALGMPGIARPQLTDGAKWALECGNMARIRGAVNAAALDNRVKMRLSDFDAHPWLLPCANGLTYDFEAGTLRASRRDDYMTICVPVAASATPVPHPRWDAFLAVLTGDDESMVNYHRRVMGMLLTGSVRDQTFHIWNGEKDNGKTTLLRFLAEFLGAYAFKIPMRALLEKRGPAGILHDLADMRGKRLVYSEEFKLGNVLDEGTMKDITGGGNITADRKGENNITFPSTAKVIIATNNLPELRDVGPAIRKRIRCAPFPVNIPQLLAERGHPLKDQDVVIAELLEEAPGILQDLVAAVGEWRALGTRLPMAEPVMRLTEQYLVEQDPLSSWMATCCVADGHTEERPFRDWYLSFLEQSGRDEKRTTTNWFGRQLRAHGFIKRETISSPVYTGPALTTDADCALDEVKIQRSFVADDAGLKQGGLFEVGE